MEKLKTAPRKASVTAFLKAIPDDQRRADCEALEKHMKRVTRAQPTMWGTSVVGFGRYHYRYESGREGDWFLSGFAPRKGALTIYVMAGVAYFPHLLRKLGKHRTGAGCLYLRRLEDVDLAVLEELIAGSVKELKRRYK